MDEVHYRSGPLNFSSEAPRAEAQRERILCTALKCFIEYVSHAASMANIADAAQMSAGPMYRYFEHKNAIVLAIVRRQLEEKCGAIRGLHASCRRGWLAAAVNAA